jgi:hypothetical protein
VAVRLCECAIKDCNLPCPWDDKYKKWWKHCTPSHAQKATEEHVACPATIITVTVDDRVNKLYLDPSGKLSTPRIYHNFQYYVLGVTYEGYMIVGGMKFRDQVLFVIGRMFDSLGRSPARSSS